MVKGKKLIFKQYKNLLIILLIAIFAGFGLGVYSQNCNKIQFYSLKNGIYVVSVDKAYFAKNSDVYVPDFLDTVEDAAKKTNPKIAINAGFFDPENGKTISYVLKNNKIIINPEENSRLTESKELKPHLDKIFNRAEFRVLKCFNDENEEYSSFDIAPHNEPVDSECNFLYSIQAGPELAPDFDLEKEFFILKKDGKVVRDSVSALHKVARSAIGITKDRILLVAVSNQNPMTLKELSEFMKNQGVEQAMAFDGGSSTSLYVNLPDKKFILNSAKDDAARRVKSVLVIK